MAGLIARRLEEVAIARMGESPVVLLQGPRSVGKSTLLRRLADRHGARVVDLDDPGVRAAAADDPGLFVSGHNHRPLGFAASSRLADDPGPLVSGHGPVFIDEYQRVPEVLDYIKAELNRDSSPGRFMLAGSTRFDALPLASQSLTGRLHRLEIHPFSQGEIDGRRESLLETLLSDAAAAVTPRPSASTRGHYVSRIARGGFPLVLERAQAARDRWFDDYLALCLERDLLEAGRVRRPAALVPLLSRLAAQTAQMLNMSRAGDGAGLPASTAADHIRLFESSFLVRLLPAWGTTLGTSVAVRPKVHIADSGLAARLLRLTPDKLARLDAGPLQQFGHLLETFVAGEVLKQASWMGHRPHVGHWRTHGGAEVDLVIEDGRDGSVLGLEVKANSRVRAADRRGLRALRDALGERFSAGVVFYTGGHCLRFSNEADARIIALPIDRLWLH